MLYPLMLAGLRGLSVPIIIHLIHRQRLKPQLLATSQFLDQQDLANAFAPVPRDLLQLLLRLLLLALFVLLMSRLVMARHKRRPADHGRGARSVDEHATEGGRDTATCSTAPNDKSSN